MTACLQAQGATNAAASISFGTTIYNCLANSWFSNSSSLTTEALAQITYRSAGTLTNLWANVSANTVNGTSTLKARKNGADGNLVVSIGASTTGLLEDTSNSDAVSAGDELALQLITGGSSGTMRLGQVSSLFAASSDTAHRLSCSGTGALSTASTTFYCPFSGNQDSENTTENRAEQYIGFAGTVRNLSVTVGTNARGTTTTFISRKNGGNGSLTLSVGAGATGIFEDTSNSDSFAATDLGCIAITTGTGAGNFNPNQTSVEYLNTSSQGLILLGKAGSGFSLAAAVTRYGCVGGNMTTLATTQNDVRNKALADATISLLSCFLSANTINGTSTLTLGVGGSASALTVSIGASTSGRFTDSTHSVAVVATDLLTLQYVGGGASGTSAWRTVSMSAQYAAPSPGTGLFAPISRGGVISTFS